METPHERLLRQLLSTHRCTTCRQRFRRDGFSFVARHEKLWVVSARCSACHTQQMFWVSLKNGVQATPAEISPTERKRLEALPPITSDDVLDMHQFLARFDGDFAELFAPRV